MSEPLATAVMRSRIAVALGCVGRLAQHAGRPPSSRRHAGSCRSANRDGRGVYRELGGGPSRQRRAARSHLARVATRLTWQPWSAQGWWVLRKSSLWTCKDRLSGRKPDAPVGHVRALRLAAARRACGSPTAANLLGDLSWPPLFPRNADFAWCMSPLVWNMGGWRNCWSSSPAMPTADASCCASSLWADAACWPMRSKSCGWPVTAMDQPEGLHPGLTLRLGRLLPSLASGCHSHTRRSRAPVRHLRRPPGGRASSHSHPARPQPTPEPPPDNSSSIWLLG